MFAENSYNKSIILLLSVIFMLVSVFSEWLGATGVYMGIGYVLAIVLTVFIEDKLTTILTAVGSCLLLMLSVFYFHPNEDFLIVTINHSWSIIGVLVTMFIILQIKNLLWRDEENRKQIEALFKHATEGIILTNRAGEIVLVNPQALNLFGYTDTELVGQKIEVLIPGNTVDKHHKYREKFHENPSNRTMGSGRDLYAKRKDGTIFPVEVSLSHYKLGRESFVIAFVIDITLRKENEKTLQNQKKELEEYSVQIKQLNTNLEQKVSDRTMMLRETLAQLEKSREELFASLTKEKELGDLKSRFVSTVSHEFRTPLSTILSSASLIGKYQAPEQQQNRERHINRIKESVQFMNSMLEDLLSLGKLEEGLVETKKDLFNITEFLSDFVNEMNELCKDGKHIQYQHAGESDVYTDKRLLKLVLLNLVSNAIKFSPDALVVDVNSKVENGLLSIAVKDYGIGISEEDQQHLFERFFRARNAINIQGTGLGLHIIGKYLELMQGKISLQSKMGEGSTFTVSIPVSNN